MGLPEPATITSLLIGLLLPDRLLPKELSEDILKPKLPVLCAGVKDPNTVLRLRTVRRPEPVLRVSRGPELKVILESIRLGDFAVLGFT